MALVRRAPPDNPSPGDSWDDFNDNRHIWIGGRWQNTFNRPIARATMTVTGRLFWPTDPRVEDFCLFDFAHGMAKECRFGNQLPCHYPVATHCVVLSHYVPDHLKPWALIHDAPEGILRDMPRPIKALFAEYKPYENRLMEVFCEYLGMTDRVEPEELKPYDTRMSHIEIVAMYKHVHDAGRAKLFALGHSPAYISEIERETHLIRPMERDEALKLWLDRFAVLFPNHAHLSRQRY